MKKMHMVLCKPQGKAKTAQVPARKLAAPGLIISHLWHSWPKPEAEQRSIVAENSWLLPAQQELHLHTLKSGQGPTRGTKRTPHTPMSGQSYLRREVSALETCHPRLLFNLASELLQTREGQNLSKRIRKSPSTSSPTAGAGLACYGCSWEKVFLRGLAPSSSGLLLRSLLSQGGQAAAPGRIGQGCSSRVGTASSLPLPL